MIKNKKIEMIHNLLIKDQYDQGEWRRHQVLNPTDEPRTFPDSEIKPHFLVVCILIIP